jgi:ABC-type multidrug transport system permease subunit
MWFAMGWVLAVIYIAMLIFLGIETIRRGHWLLFFIGIVFPLLWVVGALMPPTRRAQEAGVV